MMTQPRWANKPTLNSKLHEKAWAKARAGKPQPNSGRFWHAKFDVKDDELLTDNKQTEKLSFSIRREDWKTLERQASREGLAPCLQITFIQMKGPPINLVVLPADMITRR